MGAGSVITFIFAKPHRLPKQGVLYFHPRLRMHNLMTFPFPAHPCKHKRGTWAIIKAWWMLRVGQKPKQFPAGLGRLLLALQMSDMAICMRQDADYKFRRLKAAHACHRCGPQASRLIMVRRRLTRSSHPLTACVQDQAISWSGEDSRQLVVLY